ncbi:MAG: hypothetical protein V3W50_02825 [Thermoanaerobaculia bacterium]
MKRNVMVSGRENRLTAVGRQQIHECVVVMLLIVMTVSQSACSTSTGASDGTWRANYFKDPNSVWGAIELSLIDLDFEVTDKNRFDGVIRAQSDPAADGTVIVLDINQVVYTEDQVNVFVKPSFGAGGGSANPDLLEAAAEELITKVNSKL